MWKYAKATLKGVKNFLIRSIIPFTSSSVFNTRWSGLATHESHCNWLNNLLALRWILPPRRVTASQGRVDICSFEDKRIGTAMP